MTVFGFDPDVFSAYVGFGSLTAAIIGLAFVVYQLGQAKRGILDTRDVAEATKKQVDAIEGLLDHSEKTSLLSAVLQIDAILVDYAKQRQWVNDNHKLPPNKQRKAPDIVPYMAVFERLSIAVRMGLIDHEYVYRFYSSRFRRLLRMEHVRHLMLTQPHGWQHLISLAVDLDDWVEKHRARNLRPVVVQQAPPPNERDAGPDVVFLARLRGLPKLEPDVSTNV